MTTKEFLKQTGIKMSLPTLRKILLEKEEDLKGTGSIIVSKNQSRNTYNIVNADKVLQLIS